MYSSIVVVYFVIGCFELFIVIKRFCSLVHKVQTNRQPLLFINKLQPFTN